MSSPGRLLRPAPTRNPRGGRLLRHGARATCLGLRTLRSRPVSESFLTREPKSRPGEETEDGPTAEGGCETRSRPRLGVTVSARDSEEGPERVSLRVTACRYRVGNDLRPDPQTPSPRSPAFTRGQARGARDLGGCYKGPTQFLGLEPGSGPLQPEGEGTGVAESTSRRASHGSGWGRRREKKRTVRDKSRRRKRKSVLRSRGSPDLLEGVVGEKTRRLNGRGVRSEGGKV